MIRKIATPYGKARVYQKKGVKSRGLVMVVPGFSESLSHNRELVDFLARRGFDAFTFSQPRRRTSATSSVLERNKAIILSILQAVVPDGEKVHAVAHSFGSPALLKVAHENPGLFTELILMQPSGIAGEQKFPELVRRTAKKVVRNNISTIRDRHLYKLKPGANQGRKPRSATTRKLIRAQLSSGYLIAKNPRLALKEAFTAIRHDIASDVAAMQALGVPVHIVVAHDDELFRMSEDGTGFERISSLPGIHHSVADQHAPHDTFWLHPERTAETIEMIIEHVAASH